MRQDTREGFLYPEIDLIKCINCGCCEEVCPVLHKNNSRTPYLVYAARAKDEKIRFRSSSGGMFLLLARKIIEDGGIVCGAAFDHNDWHVYHRLIDNERDLGELCGSKYVQSDMNDSYIQVAHELANGRKVLFCGTPCQVAGLRNYLNAKKKIDANRLLLVDIVCHAVPSPLAWKKYLEKRVSGTYGAKKDGRGQITGISFRCKNYGWKRYALSLDFADGKRYNSVFNKDPYMRGFLAELYNRTSCHDCRFKNFASGSDITLADYWGVDSRFPDMDDDKGTSLVIVSSHVGREAFNDIADEIDYKESDFQHACNSQGSIMYSTFPHRNRETFFRKIHDGDFDMLVDDLLKPSLLRRLINIAKRVIKGVLFR